MLINVAAMKIKNSMFSIHKVSNSKNKMRNFTKKPFAAKIMQNVRKVISITLITKKY